MRSVALVTGGAFGIGLECALSFVRSGMAVAIADVNDVALAAASEDLRTLSAEFLAQTCDVTREEAVVTVHDAIRDRFGRLDILVTAAGIDLHRGIAETSQADWQRVIDINLTGGFLCIKHAQAMMKANKFGRIICLGSTSGVVGIAYPAYSASKAALIGLVRSVARELSPHNITLNVVAPGPVRTPLTDRLWRDDPERLGRLTKAVPVGRVATAKEIAAVIAFLASDAAGYINAIELVVDGGLTSIVELSTRIQT